MEMNETSKIGSSMLSIYDKIHNKLDVKWNYSALKCKKGSIQKSLLFLNATYGGAPGERTFSRVKVPSPPGSGKGKPKARVSVVRRNLKKAGF